GESLRLAQSWIADCSQIDAAVELSPAIIANPISGPQNSFVLTQPRDGPAEANSRRKIVPVVLVPLRVRVRRVFAGELHCGDRTFRASGLPHIGKTRSRNSKQSCGSSNGQNLRAVLLPRHAVVVVAHAQIQRQVRANLPI